MYRKYKGRFTNFLSRSSFVEKISYLQEKDREKTIILSRYHRCLNFCLIFYVYKIYSSRKRLLLKYVIELINILSKIITGKKLVINKCLNYKLFVVWVICCKMEAHVGKCVLGMWSLVGEDWLGTTVLYRVGVA